MILIGRIDPSLVPTPPAGKATMFVGLDGVWRAKLENGSILVYQSGISPEDVQQIVAAFFQDSTTINVTHDDPNNILTAEVVPSEVDHNSLKNLTIGDPHTQYLTQSRGDVRYYTKTELNAGQLDSRYYTEAEVNALLNAKINLTSIGLANGVAGLDGSQKILMINIPSGIDHTGLSNIGTNSHAQIDSHIASNANPHGTTAVQVGLGNCNNTSDANKPISIATQAALDLKYNASNPNGYEGATQLNARDTANRNRANHSGTQSASTISDFASSVLSTALAGLSLVTSTIVDATDTVLQAIGKLQAQITAEKWERKIINTFYGQTSNVTFTNLTQLAFPVVAGDYIIEIYLPYDTAATTTGLSFALTKGASISGELSAHCWTMNSGTAMQYRNLNAFDTAVLFTDAKATTLNLLKCEIYFRCFSGSGSDVITPQIRSEVNGSQVSIPSRGYLTYKKIS